MEPGLVYVTINCYGDADLAAAAEAHRNQCLQIETIKFTGSGVSDALVAGRKAAVYPGGELIVAARLAKPGHTHIVVEGVRDDYIYAKFAEQMGFLFRACQVITPVLTV